MTKSVDNALSWVNTTRIAFGLDTIGELEPGLRYDSMTCVLANSLRDVIQEMEYTYAVVTKFGDAKLLAETWGTGVAKKDNLYFVRTPDDIEDFLKRFDRGSFPELEANLMELVAA